MKLQVDNWAETKNLNISIESINWKWWSFFEIEILKPQWHESSQNMGFASDSVKLSIDYLQYFKNKYLPIDIYLEKAQIYYFRNSLKNSDDAAESIIYQNLKTSNWLLVAISRCDYVYKKYQFNIKSMAPKRSYPGRSV